MKLLATLERLVRPIAVRNLTFVLITVQVSCLVGGLIQPELLEVLALYPHKVLQGEVWRVVTFLAMPTVQHPIWALFFYYLFYLMGTALEGLWGDVRYTLYLLISYVATILVAIIGAYFLESENEVSNAFLEASVFLAFAWIYPDFELRIMFILPVKVKWLALLTWFSYAFMISMGILSFQQGGWLLSLTVLASVANFIAFFGAELIGDVRAKRRRTNWSKKVAVDAKVPRHCCAICGITNLSHPKMEFRYCTKCADHPAYCQDHLRNHEHRVATLNTNEDRNR